MMDVSQFIDSQEMREYLKAVQLSERTCEELVCGSPKPLAKKLAWLEQQGSACAEEVMRALEGLKLKPGEFIYLTEKWYDSDFIWWNQFSGVPFSSLDAAVRHIRQEMVEEEGWDENSWFQLDKWVPGEDGAYRQAYTYYLIRDEIVYFENYPTVRRDPFCGAPDLNIPIPFKPGDIVTVDCRPFMPIKPVVLLEVDNHDYCGVTCLFRREEDGKWEVGTVKHSRCWSVLPHVFPAISPLYRLASFRGELIEGEWMLESVSDYIDGDVKKGQDLWADLNQAMNRLDREWLKNEEICSFLG